MRYLWDCNNIDFDRQSLFFSKSDLRKELVICPYRKLASDRPQGLEANETSSIQSIVALDGQNYDMLADNKDHQSLVKAIIKEDDLCSGLYGSCPTVQPILRRLCGF